MICWTDRLRADCQLRRLLRVAITLSVGLVGCSVGRVAAGFTDSRSEEVHSKDDIGRGGACPVLRVCGDSCCEAGEACLLGACRLVTELGNWLAVGASHGCALGVGGKAYCWGAGLYLGTPDLPVEQSVPVQVALDGAVIAVSSACSHTCAATATGEVWCWGENTNRQLGVGLPSDFSSVPVNLGAPFEAVSLGVGESHSCGIDDAGGAWCWGFNGYGACGQPAGESGLLPDPVAVHGMSDIVHLAACRWVSYEYSCALTGTGEVFCWGYYPGWASAYEFLGNVEYFPTGGKASYVDAGPYVACAVTEDGELWCWGERFDCSGVGGFANDSLAPGPVPQPFPLPENEKAVSVSFARASVCIITEGGDLYCYGCDDLAAGDGRPEMEWNKIALDAPAIAVRGTMDNYCVLLADGRVFCWGDGDSGQLGNGKTESSTTPQQVLLPTGE